MLKTVSSPETCRFFGLAHTHLLPLVSGLAVQVHEDWAVVEDTHALAPSFEHGASPVFNATAVQMVDPSRYAARARARHFGRDRSPSDVAQEGLTLVGPDVSDMWVHRLRSIEDTQIQQIVEAIPVSWMSVPRRTFVTAVVGANRRRLLA